MNREIIFQKLWSMRLRMMDDQARDDLPEPESAILYDVARELGLTERQAQLLAGDIRPDEPTIKLNLG